MSLRSAVLAGWVILVASICRAEIKVIPMEDTAAPERYLAIVDATGESIEGASVQVESAARDGQAPVQFAGKTNDAGVIAIRGMQREPAKATISHPDYGSATGDVRVTGERHYQLTAPLVKKGTPEADRAVRGVVKGPTGEPLAGARIRCTELRTPGEGLIPSYDPSFVLTDDKGQFCLYVEDRSDRKNERGKMIPPSSRFTLEIVPANEELFPHFGTYTNEAAVDIQVAQPERQFTFQYESPGGGLMANPPLPGQCSMSYVSDGPKRVRGQVPARYLSGGRLPYGTYTFSGFRQDYEPLVVAANSPEKLTFRLKSAVTYQGKVIDGITGKPVGGSYVMAMSAIAHGNLARLTDEQWKTLRELPTKPDKEDPRLEGVRDAFSFVDIARTNEKGEYELTTKPGTETYSILVFDQHMLPLAHRIYKLKPNAQNKAQLPDLPLFPAAYVIIKPSVAENVSVWPRWTFAKAGEQPEWFDWFREWDNGNDKQFKYDGWPKVNESQPIYVPADVTLRIRFEAPYDEQYATFVTEKPIHLARGATLDLGDIKLPASRKLSVKVTGPDGKPVEGVPVRRKNDDDNSYGVAHNTDAQGLAEFWISPTAGCEIVVSDHVRNRKAANLRTRFEAKQTFDPNSPPTIQLTQPQMDEIFNGKRK